MPQCRAAIAAQEERSGDGQNSRGAASKFRRQGSSEETRNGHDIRSMQRDDNDDDG